MNSLLASIVGFLNGLLALIFIICGAVVGLNFDSIMAEYLGYPYSSFGNYGVILGLIIGFIFAVLFCGLLALFISMRKELIAIRRLLDKQSQEGA